MKFYRVKEIAELLQVNQTKVLSWINGGHLEAVNVGSGSKRPRYRISQACLDDFLKKRTKDKPVRPTRRRKQPSGRIFIPAIGRTKQV